MREVAEQIKKPREIDEIVHTFDELVGVSIRIRGQVVEAVCELAGAVDIPKDPANKYPENDSSAYSKLRAKMELVRMNLEQIGQAIERL